MKLSLSKDGLMMMGFVLTILLFASLCEAQHERDRERVRQEQQEMLDALTCPAGQIAVLEEYEGQVYRPPDPGDPSWHPRDYVPPSEGYFESVTRERAICATPSP